MTVVAIILWSPKIVLFFSYNCCKTVKDIDSVFHYLWTLQWRHNESDVVSNHQHLDCLLNQFFGHRWMKRPKLRHDDVIKCKHFRVIPCAENLPVTGEFPHKGQWRGALVFSLICAWINGWVNNHETGDLRCHRGHCDVTVMALLPFVSAIHRCPSQRASNA